MARTRIVDIEYKQIAVSSVQQTDSEKEDSEYLKRKHFSATTYELRLKSLWKASKKFVQANPLPPATVLFKPRPDTVSVTKALTYLHNTVTTTTSTATKPQTTTASTSSNVSTKLSRNQRCKIRAKQRLAENPLVERLSRRDLKRARIAERELMEQVNSNKTAQ